MPLTSVRLAELFLEAGAPKGVLQVVHGGKEQVDQLLKHPQGEGGVLRRLGRRRPVRLPPAPRTISACKSFAGAKNRMVIMPDADKAQVIGNLVGASVGAAEQRCMAISVAVLVGAAREWIPEIRDALARSAPAHGTTAAPATAR
ncbi:aldehyde dehydrogenase family protein [Pseudomonas aeruginosa]|nr:aldehyde dehydrogenase family protein [Pseudomonas aeruginosa]